MSNTFIPVTQGSGLDLDSRTIVAGWGTVVREVIALSDELDTTGLCARLNTAAPASTDPGLTVRTADVAHGAADAGQPLKIGGVSSLASPSAVAADSDRVQAWFSRTGEQATIATPQIGFVYSPNANGGRIPTATAVNVAAVTAGTGVQLVAAAVGKRCYVLWIAAGAEAGSDTLYLRDGSGAGAIIFAVRVGSAAGTPLLMDKAPPFTSVNSALYLDVKVTDGTGVPCTVGYFLGP